MWVLSVVHTRLCGSWFGSAAKHVGIGDKGQVRVSPGVRLAVTRHAFGTLAARLENLKDPKFAIHYI